MSKFIALKKKTLKNKFDNQMLTIRIGGGGRVGGRENNWPTDWDKIGAWRLPECSRLPTRDVRVCGICHSFPRKFKAVVYCWALQRWSNRYVFFSENPIYLASLSQGNSMVHWKKHASHAFSDELRIKIWRRIVEISNSQLGVKKMMRLGHYHHSIIIF